MRRDSSGALTQLFEVVLLLASEQGPIEERLAHANFAYLQSLDVGSLPADAQRRFEKIRAELKRMYPEPGAWDGVDRSAAVDLAQGIIMLYDALNP